VHGLEAALGEPVGERCRLLAHEEDPMHRPALSRAVATLIRAGERPYSVGPLEADDVPEDVRRDSYEDEGSGKKSTTRVLVMLAVLVSLVAVLGMLQVREKHREAVLWPTAPFEAGVSVLGVVFHPGGRDGDRHGG
jgi:hypothetical protein